MTKDIIEAKAEEVQNGRALIEGADDTEILVRDEALPMIFTDEATVDLAIAKVRTEIESRPVDLTTRKGREAVASNAAKPRRFKKPVKDFIKGKTDGHYTEIKRLNGIRDKFDHAMTEIAETARKPLDEWENREKVRVDALKSRLDEITNTELGDTIEAVSQQLETFRALEVTEEEWEEFACDATNAVNALIVRLIERKDYLEREAAIEAERAAEAERIAEEMRKAEEDRAAREKALEEERAEAAAKAEAERIAREEAEQELNEARAEIARIRAQAAADSAKTEEPEEPEQSPVSVDGASGEASGEEEDEDSATTQEPAPEQPSSLANDPEVDTMKDLVSAGLGSMEARLVIDAVKAGRISHLSWNPVALAAE
jgi:chromosome segregation ATPase